ncbi:hypothetical protein EVAR_49797_1 [Eumeta japonica]|uniref:Uncharacterized protein n=1 Tax=Eumeta variegata TaxID=151549 RepID=A0A4C1YRX8_EUMVA|nr:hypothetical protein EVAR_49797_1 [Eumeta japonica]
MGKIEHTRAPLYTVELCYDLPSAVFPTNFDKKVFKKRAYSHFKRPAMNFIITSLRLMYMGHDDRLLSHSSHSRLALMTP